MRQCRVCGCTQDRACEVLGVPCCWVEVDLCSACATVGQLLASEDEGLPWLITVLGEHAGRVLLADEGPLCVRKAADNSRLRFGARGCI